MLIEEAIKHCEEKALCSDACGLEHKQLANWLRELMQLRYNLTKLDLNKVTRLSTNDNVSINLSFDEFREVLEKIEAVTSDIQEHEYSDEIRIEKLSKIHEYTTYLFSMANTKVE